MDVLSAGGINFNKPNGAITSDQFGSALDKSPNKERTQMHRPSFDKSFSGRLVLVTFLGLEEYLYGSKTNTNELIKKGSNESN